MLYTEFESIVKTSFPELSEVQMEKFRAMEDLYKDWNSKINVISRKDIDKLYRHHILHSLAIAAYLKFQQPETYAALLKGKDEVKILDLGTGGRLSRHTFSNIFSKGKIHALRLYR